MLNAIDLNNQLGLASVRSQCLSGTITPTQPSPIKGEGFTWVAAMNVDRPQSARLQRLPFWPGRERLMATLSRITGRTPTATMLSAAVDASANRSSDASR